MIFDAPAAARLLDALHRLPGIGRRTAERMALHLLSAPDAEAYELSDALREARSRVVRCSSCGMLTEQDPCSICSDTRRDHGLICVVEHPSGVIAIEKGGSYRGVFHVLHGALNPLEGIGPDQLTVDKLLERAGGEAVNEIILATNATAEGEATAMYLMRQMQTRGVAVSRIAHGVPMGGGLEYADDVTLAHALDGRTRL